MSEEEQLLEGSRVLYNSRSHDRWMRAKVLGYRIQKLGPPAQKVNNQQNRAVGRWRWYIVPIGYNESTGMYKLDVVPEAPADK
eukprot:4972204-Amphidinium_carterae.1